MEDLGYDAGEVGDSAEEEDNSAEKPPSASVFSHEFGETVTSIYDKADACKSCIVGCSESYLLYLGPLKLGKFILWLTTKGILHKSFLLGPTGQARGATSSSLHQYFYYRK